tara:strand:- start:796 stop:1071 length:276 start_codon:yes stop_codon:yes gene_type:complete
MKVSIIKDNLIYVNSKLDFTHDHSTVTVGSIMIDRNGETNEVTKIDKDDGGNRRFWSHEKCLTMQYKSPHNMLTKSPFYAHDFIVTNDINP